MLGPRFLDYMAGRPPAEYWAFEDGRLDMNRFCITGYIAWETWLHKHFWNEVGKGNLGTKVRYVLAQSRVN